MKNVDLSFILVVSALIASPSMALPASAPQASQATVGYYYNIIYGGTCDTHGKCIPDNGLPWCPFGWETEDQGSIYSEECQRGSSCIGHVTCYSVSPENGKFTPLYEEYTINGSIPLHLATPPR